MALSKSQQKQVDDLEVLAGKANLTLSKAAKKNTVAGAKAVGISEICTALSTLVPILEALKSFWFAGKKFRATMDKYIGIINTYCPIIE